MPKQLADVRHGGREIWRPITAPLHYTTHRSSRASTPLPISAALTTSLGLFVTSPAQNPPPSSHRGLTSPCTWCHRPSLPPLPLEMGLERPHHPHSCFCVCVVLHWSSDLENLYDPTRCCCVACSGHYEKSAKIIAANTSPATEACGKILISTNKYVANAFKDRLANAYIARAKRTSPRVALVPHQDDEQLGETPQPTVTAKEEDADVDHENPGVNLIDQGAVTQAYRKIQEPLLHWVQDLERRQTNSSRREETDEYLQERP